MKKVNVYGIEETLLVEYSGGERRFERIEGTVIASKDVSIWYSSIYEFVQEWLDPFKKNRNSRHISLINLTCTP